MSNKKYMTSKQIKEYFLSDILPIIKDKESQYCKNGSIDIPLRCQAFNEMKDYLHKEGFINDKQVNSMCITKKLLHR